MANKILFVFEGECTEKNIVSSFSQHFVNESTVIYCAYCQEVYQLHKELSEDEDLDLFLLLKEKPANEGTLSSFKKDDFAEIYLFFDYDGHATKAEDEKITELLNAFDNETERGKLYLSYPMVESIRHLNDKIDFKDVTVKAKENIRYKNLVNSEGHEIYRQHPSKLTYTLWCEIIVQHLYKMNFIVSDNFSFPESIIEQKVIFDHQLAKYIKPYELVAVLSSFPPFILDYYGIDTLLEKLEQK
ncbi:MAG: hypothetical protein RI922_1839 [Bacteroidota bacterium]|jgi:hypothetical protein